MFSSLRSLSTNNKKFGFVFAELQDVVAHPGNYVFDVLNQQLQKFEVCFAQ